MILETERLILRPFTDQDIETIYALVYTAPDVRDAWSGFRGTLADFRERFATGRNWKIANGFGYFAVTLRDSGQLIGLMGFQNHADEPMDWLLLPDGSRNVGHVPGVVDAELTYALGKPHWSRGYATEAGRALVDYGFSAVGIDRIINAISPTNFRSRALMTRLGFTFLDNGNPNDMIGLLPNPARPVL